MTLRRKVANLRARLDAAPADDASTRASAEFNRTWAERQVRVVAAVPEEFRDTLRRLFALPCGQGVGDAGPEVPERSWIRDVLADRWAQTPFAPWAEMPEGFQFPRAFVEWLLNPPRRYWFAHACERCGMGIPIYRDEPDRPGRLVVFPVCPACGGPTSYSASFWEWGKRKRHEPQGADPRPEQTHS